MSHTSYPFETTFTTTGGHTYRLSDLGARASAMAQAALGDAETLAAQAEAVHKLAQRAVNIPLTESGTGDVDQMLAGFMDLVHGVESLMSLLNSLERNTKQAVERFTAARAEEITS